MAEGSSPSRVALAAIGGCLMLVMVVSCSTTQRGTIVNTAIEGARKDIHKSHTASDFSGQAIRVPPEGLCLLCVFFLPAGARMYISCVMARRLPTAACA